MSKTGKSLWAVDLIKVVAAQSILIHHMVAYGPMSWTLYPHHTALFDWIFEYGRMAVQAFLVVGGFLAARSLVPTPSEVRPGANFLEIWRLLRTRYLRLAPPYLLAIFLTIVSAFVVRQLIDDSDTPAPMHWGQMLAHIMLVQDIIGLPALTAGAWYVAIDFQLYGLLALVLVVCQWTAGQTGLRLGRMVALSVLGLTVASLFWINFNEELDAWAPYFFGAYGLGILVQWARSTRRTRFWFAVMALLVVLALLIEWRERVAVAAFTALLLFYCIDRKPLFPDRVTGVLRSLSDKSYTLFLVHYMVILLVGGVMTYLWPGNVTAATAGMGVIWVVSMAGSWVLNRLTNALMTRWN